MAGWWLDGSIAGWLERWMVQLLSGVVEGCRSGPTSG